jgi:arginine decarboxylase
MTGSLLMTGGTGEATTELAAFDAALIDAGIANANLIRLSSVIPAGATVLEKRPDLPLAEWGWRLYVVLAEQRASRSGEQAWAGIGWIQDPTDGRGLFVEHEGGSEQHVEDLIEQSLACMRSSREDTFGPTQLATRGIRCSGEPVAAIVAAVYASVPW